MPPLQILDADGAVAVEQDLRRQRIEFDSQAFRLPARHLQHALARAHALVPRGGERRVPDALLAVGAHVVGIALGGDEAQQIAEPARNVVQRGKRAGRHAPGQPTVAQRLLRLEPLDAEPAVPAVLGRVDADEAQQAPDRAVPAILHQPHPMLHRPSGPGRIAGQRCEAVPIGIVGRHEDHRIVRGAAAECAGARIKDAVRVALVVARGLGRVGIVVDPEVPCHRRVLRGVGVKGRHFVILRQALPGLVAGIAARFEQHNAHAILRQARCQCSSTSPRADDHVVAIRRHQSVLRNSIKAFLSTSLSTGSVPKAFSSSVRPSVSLNCAVPK
jgi:hypothetical protein